MSSKPTGRIPASVTSPSSPPLAASQPAPATTPPAEQGDTSPHSLPVGLEYVPITLPSEGRFYGPTGVIDTPAIPDGVIEVRKTTIAEEEAMWAAGGHVAIRLSKLIRSVCKLPTGFDPKNMLITDRMFIMLVVRRLSYGQTYDVKFKCSSCGARNKAVIDIVEDLQMTDVDPDVVEPLEVELKDAGVTVGLRFRRGMDEIELAKIAKAAENRGQEISMLQETLQRQLVTSDGEPFLNAFAKKDLLQRVTSTDLATIRIAVDKSEPGVDITVHPECSRCEEVNEFAMPFSEEFFRPTRM